MTPVEFVKKLNVGWNLGDTMDARVGRSERGEDGKPMALAPKAQETAWHNPVTTPEMIKKVAEAGFDIFRLPVSWSDFIGPAPEYTICPDFMARVSEIVDYGFDNDMTVILNLHHEDWHFPSEENYPVASAKLIAVWTQIANHFGPCCHKLIFEAMNEPRKVRTKVEWNEGDAEGREVVARLGHDFIKAVRATGGNNATRMLMVPTYAASSSLGAMEGFVLSGDANIIASVHAYTPYLFALSGDHSHHEWKPELEKDIDDLFANIDKCFLRKGIPVILGECGARRRGNNTADRVAWAKYYKKIAAKYGVPCVWWDNGRIEGTEKTELFGLLDRNKLEWAFPELVEAFVGK